MSSVQGERSHCPVDLAAEVREVWGERACPGGHSRRLSPAYNRLKALLLDDHVVREYWEAALGMEFVGIEGKPSNFKVKFARHPDVGLAFWFVRYKGRWALQMTIRKLTRSWKQAQSTLMLDSPVSLFVLVHNPAHMVQLLAFAVGAVAEPHV